MKTYVLTILLIMCLHMTAFAVTANQPDDITNAVWQLAATPGYTSSIVAAMNTVDKTLISYDALAAWMQVHTAISGLALVNPLSVYYSFLNHFEGFTFTRARMVRVSAPPASAGVSGSTITCLADTTGLDRQASLYEWDEFVFTQSGITGDETAGTWTFTDVPAGVYIIVFDGSLPTYFLTVE